MLQLFRRGFLNFSVSQVVGIIESHARAVDLMTHNYYELLYAFHIYRHNYRKGKAQGGSGCSLPCPVAPAGTGGGADCSPFVSAAGTVMFEYGMRLGREVRTLRGLQKQGNCFLAAINCLRLIRPEYAWIVQPASGAVVGNAGLATKPLSSWLQGHVELYLWEGAPKILSNAMSRSIGSSPTLLAARISPIHHPCVTATFWSQDNLGEGAAYRKLW